MRFKFIRFFYDAAAAEGGGAGAGEGGGEQTQTDAEKAKAEADALTAKIAELETQLAEAKKKKPVEKKPEKKPDNKTTDDIPEWAKKQNELIEKLVGTVTTLQAEKTTGTRKATFESELQTIEGLPDYYRDELIEIFESKTFADDAEFEAFKKKKIETATKVSKDLLADSLNVFGAPRKSSASGNTKVKNAADKDVISLVDSIM